MSEKSITHWHQSAKDMLQRIGVPGAQDYTSHAVDELAYTLFRWKQLEAYRNTLEAERKLRSEVEKLLALLDRDDDNAVTGIFSPETWNLIRALREDIEKAKSLEGEK